MYVITCIYVCLGILSFTLVLDPIYKPSGDNRFLLGTLFLISPILWSLPTIELGNAIAINAFSAFSAFALFISIIVGERMLLKTLALIVFSGLAFFTGMLLLTFFSLRLPAFVIAALLGILCSMVSQSTGEAFVFGLVAVWFCEVIGGVWEGIANGTTILDLSSAVLSASVCALSAFLLKSMAFIRHNFKLRYSKGS